VLRCPGWPLHKLPTDTGLPYTINNINYSGRAGDGSYGPVGRGGQKLSAVPAGKLADLALFGELTAERVLDCVQYDVKGPDTTGFKPNGAPSDAQQVRMIYAKDQRHLGISTLGFMEGHGARFSRPHAAATRAGIAFDAAIVALVCGVRRFVVPRSGGAGEEPRANRMNAELPTTAPVRTQPRRFGATQLGNTFPPTAVAWGGR